MQVLITGGAGFIGSHLCDAFLNKGDDITILDNLSTGTRKNIAHLEGKTRMCEGDIRDPDLVESLIKESDLVLHMAAVLGVDRILENPAEAISTNFFGSELVLNTVAKYDKKILIASTSEIYGKNMKQPLTEMDDRVIGPPQKLRWNYSDAKALEEALAYYLYLSKNLRVITVRLFNTVGPRQKGDYGMVIPRFIESAINNKPIVIFGDGTQSRVFCHVLDVVEAIQMLVENDSSLGEVFNIGGQGEITIYDLASFIIDKTNSNSEILFKPYNDAYTFGYEDMMRRVPDISKIQKMIGWSPNRDLSAVIEDIIRIKL